jgi:hypothetical protein
MVADLESSVKAIVESGQLHRWLNAMASNGLSRWSANNRLLAAVQMLQRGESLDDSAHDGLPPVGEVEPEGLQGGQGRLDPRPDHPQDRRRGRRRQRDAPRGRLQGSARLQRLRHPRRPTALITGPPRARRRHPRNPRRPARPRRPSRLLLRRDRDPRLPPRDRRRHPGLHRPQEQADRRRRPPQRGTEGLVDRPRARSRPLRPRRPGLQRVPTPPRTDGDRGRDDRLPRQPLPRG